MWECESRTAHTNRMKFKNSKREMYPRGRRFTVNLMGIKKTDMEKEMTDNLALGPHRSKQSHFHITRNGMKASTIFQISSASPFQFSFEYSIFCSDFLFSNVYDAKEYIFHMRIQFFNIFFIQFKWIYIFSKRTTLIANIIWIFQTGIE